MTKYASGKDLGNGYGQNKCLAKLQIWCKYQHFLILLQAYHLNSELGPSYILKVGL